MTRLERLRELADLLQESLAEAPVGVRAQIAAQYRATLAEIEEIEPATQAKGSPVDELRKRRATRQAGASGTS